MTPDLSFFISHVRVDLICPFEEVLRGLHAIWSSARIAQVTTERCVVIEIESNTPYRILCDGVVIDETEDSTQLLPRAELTINDLFLQWHENLTVMHAALLQHNDCTLLLAGPSGSGKSSLSLQAVRMGWTYHTDELTVTDGLRIWGVCRAIQFDAAAVGEQLPDFLATTDTASYRWVHPQLGPLCQPLVSVPVAAQAEAPRQLENVMVVILGSGGKTGLKRLNGVNALMHLHEACFSTPGHDLGSLAGRAWTLNWTDPELAIRQIQNLHDELCAA